MKTDNSALEKNTFLDTHVAADNNSNEIVKTSGRRKLESWLNKSMKIEMTDGRTLIGTFLCTDRDCNVILGQCNEYLRADEGMDEEPRVLGLAMVPGHHIVSIYLDCIENESSDIL